jgi:hypothetical protein
LKKKQGIEREFSLESTEMLAEGFLINKLEFDVPWTVPPMSTEEATYSTLPLADTSNLKEHKSTDPLLSSFSYSLQNEMK